MGSRFSILFLAHALVFGATADSPAQPKSLQDLNTFVEKSMQQWQVPGLAIAVVKDGQVLLAKGYGVRTVGEPGAVDEDTVFAIASNTKAFTATAVGLLVEDGKLGWDEQVIDILPDFALPDPVATRKATVRDLLCHRIGLEEFSGDMLTTNSTLNAEQIVSRMRFLTQAKDLRTGFAYSNLAFLAAGQVVEKVSKMRWGAFVEARLFKPLGMTRTTTHLADLDRLGNVASPHSEMDGKIKAQAYTVLKDEPAGAICSSVRDMANWLILQTNDGVFAGKRIVSAKAIEQTRRSHNLVPRSDFWWKIWPDRHFITYGLGWVLTDYHGRMLVFHSGSVPGMASNTAFVPEEKIGVVVLTNLAEHHLSRVVTKYVLDKLLNVSSRDWNQFYSDLEEKKKKQQEQKRRERSKSRMPGTKTTQPIPEFAGTYRDQAYGLATIHCTDGKLFLKIEHHPDLVGALEHWHHDVFKCRWNDPLLGEGFLYFDFDDQLEIEQFRIKFRPDWIDSHEYHFVRSG